MLLAVAHTLLNLAQTRDGVEVMVHDASTFANNLLFTLGLNVVDIGP